MGIAQNYDPSSNTPPISTLATTNFNIYWGNINGGQQGYIHSVVYDINTNILCILLVNTVYAGQVVNLTPHIIQPQNTIPIVTPIYQLYYAYWTATGGFDSTLSYTYTLPSLILNDGGVAATHQGVLTLSQVQVYDRLIRIYICTCDIKYFEYMHNVYTLHHAHILHVLIHTTYHTILILYLYYIYNPIYRTMMAMYIQ